MKEKAFTLIELLAVIVILAIIALIATPIILGIIKDARENAKKRSAELVYTGVEYAYTQSLFKEGSENVVDDVTLETIDKYLNVDNVANHGFESSDTNKEKLHIVTKDNVYCEVTKNTSTKTFEVKCGTDINYTSSNVMEIKTIAYDVYTAPSHICLLQDGTSKTTGAEYLCSLDTDRTFYVLGDNEDSTKIDLIMNMNYTDETVPVTMKWCKSGTSNTCNHDNLDSLVSHVQEVFGSNVVVSLPSFGQIYKAAGNKTSGFPTWLYDYLNGTTHPVSNVYGYWTSTAVGLESSTINYDLENGIFATPLVKKYVPIELEPDHACYVGKTVGGSGHLSSLTVNDASDGGFRPVITISKSLMN
jgi:type IV pilus assembly protein PilA